VTRATPSRAGRAVKVKGLRDRVRADGSVRAWWEPNAAERAAGMTAVELDGNRMTWSRAEADRLNKEAAARLAGDAPRARPVQGRTMQGLVDVYRRGPLRDLAPKSQRSYGQNLRTIERKWGTDLVADFTKPVMYEWYRTLRDASGDTQARALIRMMSILFAHAELIGWRAEGSNPCARLKLVTPRGRGRAASWAEFDALVAAADAAGLPAIGAAVRLSMLQGQRQTDVILATVGEFIRAPLARGQAPVLVWSLTRRKRGTRGTLPVHPLAMDVVEARIAGRPADARLLLDDRIGRPYDEYLFQTRWAEVRERAAQAVPSVATLQFRDLRRTFGVMSRAGGSTEDDVGDVLGNSAATNPQLAEIYMPATIHTTTRAVMAIIRPDDGTGDADGTDDERKRA
jgi:hypothetical protein